MKKVIVFIIIVAVLAVWFIFGLNKAVTLDESVSNSWAQVENQLQRRNDLIPNLVSTVKGYALHEKTLFEDVANARSQWAKASSVEDKVKAASQVDSVLSRLIMVAESYPELKANQNFLMLQDQLEGTENRIAVERMRYNENVRIFNTYQRTVFGSIFTKLRNLSQPKTYFKAEEKAKTVPKVEF